MFIAVKILKLLERKKYMERNSFCFENRYIYIVSAETVQMLSELDLWNR